MASGQVVLLFTCVWGNTRLHHSSMAKASSFYRRGFAWGSICVGNFVFQNRAKVPTLFWGAGAKFTTHFLGVLSCTLPS